jgi:hypothetical protein
MLYPGETTPSTSLSRAEAARDGRLRIARPPRKPAPKPVPALLPLRPV